jgi:hypothetical protein
VKQHPATATATATEASALSAGGAAGLDAPKDGDFAHKGWRAINALRRAELEGRKHPRTRLAEEREEKQAMRAAREAEASARRSRMEELTKTLGPEAAKQALRREDKQAKEARRRERLEARAKARKDEIRKEKESPGAHRRGGIRGERSPTSIAVRMFFLRRKFPPPCLQACFSEA